uniref:Activator of Hsp90 ATPase AHSA1-like N-terminal domain-containing protein n=1 Tax=Aureoumbra lagunensis TaxID=44058 RepID=A0A7S3K4E0_9STRA|mmetsp:Transcript_367/g.493  ORF Transcript_367/g.493 Transcript_367/m.493 type:complete len:352 (+) Transcript_367:44-1099(+)
MSSEEELGKENRERFHWEERDLTAWIRQWLEMNINDATLIDNEAHKIRCRESYRDDGECVLQSRKNEMFVVYGLDLIVKWYAQRRLGDRVLGEARGRIQITNFCSTLDEEEYIVQGEWQYKRPLSQGTPGLEGLDAGSKIDADASDIEIDLRNAVSQLFLGPLKQRLQELRTQLNRIPIEKANTGSIPDPQPLPKIDHLPMKRAEASTREFVQSLKAQMRSPNFEARLEEIRTGTRSDGDFRSMCLTDADIPIIVAALPPKKKNKNEHSNNGTKSKDLTSLDLSYNEITDAGLQPLLCALATGAAPSLRTLRFDQTKLSDVAKKQFIGLTSIRKNITLLSSPSISVDVDDE